MSNPIVIDCKDLPTCGKVCDIEDGYGLDVEKVAKIVTLCESCENKKPELN